MTLVMFDSVDVSQLPSGDYAYAGYVNGRYQTFQSVVRSFPGKPLLSIAVTSGADAECLDVEKGDATNADAPAWVKRQIGRGVEKPVVYTSASNVDPLLSVLARAGLGRSSVRLWAAHYGAGEHICGPNSCRACREDVDGTQWNNRALGRNLDQSILTDSFFTQPTPAPPPIIGPPVQIGDGMAAIPYNNIGLDDQGNGWEPCTASADKITDIVAEGSFPPVDGYWPLPRFGRQARASTPEHPLPDGTQSVIEIQGGVPHQVVSFTVITAD